MLCALVIMDAKYKLLTEDMDSSPNETQDPPFRSVKPVEAINPHEWSEMKFQVSLRVVIVTLHYNVGLQEQGRYGYGSQEGGLDVTDLLFDLHATWISIPWISSSGPSVITCVRVAISCNVISHYTDHRRFISTPDLF
ncbi:hypothetical protein TNCV_1937641 [Trichonephila clavipes]|nr:hypothetical protein TNCV_1937641 [Trichonephila clavipes]